MKELLTSKSQEYYTPVEAILPILPYIKNFKKVWCPFDTAESNYVKVLREYGHEVVHSHIDEGENFFLTEPKDCDIIISNPPFNCLTPTHMVLTKDGIWKSIKDVKVGEYILSLNYDTDELSYQQIISKVENKISEDIYKFKHRGLDLEVTKNHRMLAYKTTGKLSVGKDGDLVTADNVKFSNTLKTHGFKWVGTHIETFILEEVFLAHRRKHKYAPRQEIDMLDWLRFFGLWIADGSTDKTKNSSGNQRYCVSIKQHECRAEYVRCVLDKLPFKYKEYVYDHKIKFEICSKQLWLYLIQFGDSREKYLPKWLLDGDLGMLKTFMDGYMFGDSFVNDYGYTVLSTVSNQLAINLQEVVLKLGNLVNVHSDGYINTLSVPKNGKEKSTWYKNPIIEHYDGMVYCVTLENNSVFLTKHNDKVAFTGNCKTEIFEKLFQLGKPFMILISNLSILDTTKRWELFSKNPFEIMVFNKRVRYFLDYGNQEEYTNPPFNSWYVCSKVLPEKIIFERLDRQ